MTLIRKQIFLLFPFIIFFLFCTAQINLNNGLVAYYPFSGNANDVSGNNNNGIVTNANLTTDMSGNSNAAFLFNGNNSYIRVPHSTSLNSTDKITVCMKIFSYGGNSSSMLLNRYKLLSNGWGNRMYGAYFNIAPSTNVGFEVWSPGGCNQIPQYYYWANENSAISDNQWYCLVFVFDGLNIKLYINGELRDTKPSLVNYIDTCDGTQDLFIGSYYTGVQSFNGKIDDVRIYNRPLNDDEIVTYSLDCGAYIISSDFTYTTDACLTSKILFRDSSHVIGTTIDSYVWDFGDGNFSNQPIISHTYSDTGTYIVKLIVKDNTGHQSIKQKNVRITSLTKRFANAGSDTTLCPSSQSYLLKGSGGLVYKWSPCDSVDNCSSPNPSLLQIKPVNHFYLEVTDQYGCVDRDTVVIYRKSRFADAGSDKQICNINTTIELNARGGRSYSWNPCIGLSDCNSSDPVLHYSNIDKYWVEVTDEYGCVDIDSVNILISGSLSHVSIPNSFTPNRDGINDLIKVVYPFSSGIFYFRIYNRWGQKIFETHDIRVGWDGTLNGKQQNAGVYSYEVYIKEDGCDAYYSKGVITLLR